jgi:hypothetical protein
MTTPLHPPRLTRLRVVLKGARDVFKTLMMMTVLLPRG